MKLVRHGPPGREKPGLLDAFGIRRDLSGHVPDIGPEQLAPDGIRYLAELGSKHLPEVPSSVRYGPPLTGVRKFIAVGLNYADHAEESGMPIPDEPVIFMKATSCIQGPYDELILPKNSRKTDWEVELGVVIGMEARYVAEKDALNHVAGYLVVHDVSEREYQLERGGQWDKGKGCDTFGPIGPWLVTADEVGDPHELGLWLDVNDQRMQKGSTRTMIFSVACLVSYISGFMTLQPGDIITTGTPPGVGMGRVPPSFLQAGDTVSLGIDKLGNQRQEVVRWRPPS